MTELFASNLVTIGGPLLLGLILIVAFLCSIYKVADVDKALVITGGKEPVIKVSGGSFVIPIFRKASYFDLCMLTVSTDSDEIKTKTSVPIIVDWTAQIRPTTKDVTVLKKAIVSFKERGQNGIIDDVKLTLMGSVRSVVASMTPEQVQNDKETFKNEIVESVSDELADMGLELVSLNIQDITDNNGYYNDIAAIDREEKRRDAEKVKATANQQIRQQNAASENAAKQSELETELLIAEKERDNALKKAEYKAETDKANADAEIAGSLQRTVRAQEIAVEEGKVAVVKQEQANLAAKKEQEVKKTNAETAKIEATIKAQEESEVAKINAQAKAEVAVKEAEGKAKAAEADAAGKANAAVREAEGNAKAIEAEATAAASATKAKGEAEASVISKKGLAEADAIKAKLLAEAEGEKALAEARASNEKVNFEIEKIKIEAEARVQIATKTAEIMAEIGKNAEFVNIGGSASGNTGNVFIDTMSSIPGLMKMLNAENEATRQLGSDCTLPVLWFSPTRHTPLDFKELCREKDGAVYLDGDLITLWDGRVERRLLNRKDILLPGKHNLENYMTAIALCREWITPEDVSAVASSFLGVRHRLERVRTLDGIAYYNSSIDSTPTRTAAALSALDPIRPIVICGGYDKHVPFAPLAESLFAHAKAVVLTGATADAIEAALNAHAATVKRQLPTYKEPDFTRAVTLAHRLSERGDTVLLSPACASFDAFRDFEARGDRFCEIVNGFKAKNENQ